MERDERLDSQTTLDSNDDKDLDNNKVTDTQKDDKDKDFDPDERISYLESELKKVIQQRDRAKRERRTLQEKLRELEPQVSKLSDFDKIQQELQELREFRQKVLEEEEKRKLEKADEVERERIRAKKEIEKLRAEFDEQLKTLQSEREKFENELKQKQSQIEKLRDYRLQAEILDAVRKYKPINPNQIVKLVKDRFTYDPDLDRFVAIERDERGKIRDEKTVDEVLKEFAEDPDNDNLFEASVSGKGVGGSATTKTGASPAKESNYGKYNPNDPKIKKEAEMLGLSVEDLIEIYKKRDEKLERIQKQRDKIQRPSIF